MQLNRWQTIVFFIETNLKTGRTKGFFYCLVSMFSLFKADPIKKLESLRKKLLEEAMHIQRSGDLKLYALKMEAIDKIEKELDDLQSRGK